MAATDGKLRSHPSHLPVRVWAILAVAATISVSAVIAALGGPTEQLGALFMVGWAGLLVGSIWALKVGRGLLSLLLLLAFVLISVVLVQSTCATPEAREVARRAICTNNLRGLGKALLDYEAVHGQLPPVYTTDGDGKPNQSWRTIILPYLGDVGFDVGHYDDHEAWDAPSNRSVVESHQLLFICPSDSSLSNDSHDTSYVAIVGPGTAWHPGQGVKLSEVKDGPANTILLVEMNNSGIKWAEPRDLELNNLPLGITKQNLLHALSNHAGGFNAVFADGHVEFIPETISWEDFMALLTIAGGETVDRSKW